MFDSSNLDIFETTINYSFKNKDLLTLALTHPSYTKQYPEYKNNYQRLEFLGDSILEFILTDELYRLYPEDQEGQLANYRAALVNGTVLTTFADKIHLPNYIRLSDSEYHSGGNKKDSILEDALEALIGAIYLDSNLENARAFILKLYSNIPDLLNQFLPTLNPKGKLQEYVHQKYPGASLTYKLTDTSGPDHMKNFNVNVFLDDKIIGSGEGNSKKSAEEKAAIDALDLFRK